MELFKKIYMSFYDSWNLVMDAKYNPLRHIPSLPTQFYITLVLFIGWAVAFGLMAGYYTGIFTSVLVHTGVIFMLFFTASTFKDAERDKKIWWTDWLEEWEEQKERRKKQREALQEVMKRRNMSFRAALLQNENHKENTDNMNQADRDPGN